MSALQADDVALGVRVDNEAASRASAVSALQAADAVHSAAIHQSSFGCTIDANHQIQFLYGNP